MAVGNSLTFNFESAETNTQLAGPTPFFTHPRETVSVVYNQAPFSAVSQELPINVATPAPEPLTLIPAALGAIGIGAGRYRRRRVRAKM